MSNTLETMKAQSISSITVDLGAKQIKLCGGSVEEV